MQTMYASLCAIVNRVTAFETKLIVTRFARLFQAIGGEVGLAGWDAKLQGTIACGSDTNIALARALGERLQTDPWPQLHGANNPSLAAFFLALREFEIEIPDDGIDLAVWGIRLEQLVEQGVFDAPTNRGGQ